MSLDLDRVYKLLKIAEASVLHPKLASLSAIAARELEQHNAEAKKENDDLLAKEENERRAKAEAAAAEAKKQAEVDAKANVGSRLEPTSVPRAIKASETEDLTLRRPITPLPDSPRSDVHLSGANE